MDLYKGQKQKEYKNIMKIVCDQQYNFILNMPTLFKLRKSALSFMFYDFIIYF